MFVKAYYQHWAEHKMFNIFNIKELIRMFNIFTAVFVGNINIFMMVKIYVLLLMCIVMSAKEN